MKNLMIVRINPATLKANQTKSHKKIVASCAEYAS